MTAGTSSVTLDMYESAIMELQLDHNHPLYVQPSDHPGLKLMNLQLNGGNYSQWKRSVSLALSAKYKLGMVNRTFVNPSLKRCNDMVISWLLNVVTPEITSSMVYSTTAKEIWSNLEIRFTQTNGPRLYQLRKDLVSLQQGTKSIIEYFTIFCSLKDELNNLIAIPKCTCLCSCGSFKTQDQDQTIRIRL